VPGIFTLESTRERTVADELLMARFLSGFAIAALFLASLGVYGVLSYGVSLRAREMGIRLAVGADSGRVVRQVVGGGSLFIGLGLLIGLAGASALSGLLRGFLFGIDTHDPQVLAIASLTLAGVSFLAAYLPARRAGNADPCEVLRSD
jgi:putative ABC transport system permease protein